MITSIAASHAKGKFAQDKIFGASAAAVAAAAKYGNDNVINATIGAIVDEDEKLACLPTVEKVYRSLKTDDLIQYAPISGLPEFLEKVQEAAFGVSRPEAYTAAVATAGGTGAIHHAIWNYMESGDTALCSDWYWGAYKVLCTDMGRKFTTYKMLDENNRFNFPALEEKVKELLTVQDNLLYLLNTPAHNPTGHSLTEEDMDGVLKILKEAAGTDKNVILFLDVAYLDYAGEKEEVRKIFKKLSGLPANILTIVGYSMSKGFTLYGQRTGAMIGVSSSKEIIKEFEAINHYSSRATWSNINRPAMRTLEIIYGDSELLKATEEERKYYYEMIKSRADLFTKEAKACALPMLPYMAGFFLSIPAVDSDAVCNKLHENNIFSVPLVAGVRVAVCAVPLKKIGGMAEKINNAMKAVVK
ncbi:MAG: aminotransferase class I/II-fold pyridoxal phosphate-dependent enzyme [Phascolarctobacterium sp.]|nr:aminotransferase class I/II-fold pyridoxal phosphate-dependent enzyme [Phascolarctobacterium sp.]